MYIYKITNLQNNKVYIGQTIRPIQQRFSRHISDAMNNVLDTHLARAIRYYQPENFIIEQIDTAETQEELNLKEQQWIRYYNSIENGYNETDALSKCGGNTYKSKTEEEMQIIKDKLRLSKLGGKNPNAKKVKCKNVKTNEEYVFNSMAEAARFFNENNHQFISRRCLKKITNLYKEQWTFAYADSDYPECCTNPYGNRAKEVEVVDLNTNKIQHFFNYHEAEQFCHFSKDFLSKKFRSIAPEKVIIRDNFKITLLN